MPQFVSDLPRQNILLTSVIVCVCILRSRTGIEYLDRFLRRIVLLLWSGTIPPMFSMIPAVVIYHIIQNRLGGAWCACCLAMVTKLYCHSLMRSLNSRDRLKGRLQQEREAFNSIEGHKEEQGDIERSRYPRRGLPVRPIGTSHEGGTHTRFSSQVSYCTKLLRKLTYGFRRHFAPTLRVLVEVAFRLVTI